MKINTAIKMKGVKKEGDFYEMVKEFGDNRNPLDELFERKLTENGDGAYTSTGNKLLDIFFMVEYFQKHLDSVQIGTSPIEKLLAAYIRDPRYGLGYRDLGRVLMGQAKVDKEDIVQAGRWDDLFYIAFEKGKDYEDALYYIWGEVMRGNELAKKWMPRFNTAEDEFAKNICRFLNITEKEYRKAIKTNTVEKRMSCHEDNKIIYEQVPSLAMLKYYKRFSGDPRFKNYIESVRKGEKKMNFSTGTVYDIYRNRDNIDADLFFDQLPKIDINCIPIVDTSGSMFDQNDSIGKAMSIGYYLARCSSYCKDHLVSFSSRPQLIDLDNPIPRKYEVERWGGDAYERDRNKGRFYEGLANIRTGDCNNTDFGAVIRLLSGLKEFPEYFVVLSDQEFDWGSSASVKQVFKMFDEHGIKTKIVWWNLNGRNKTVTMQKDEPRCIYMSGYSPILLSYLENGFDGEKALAKFLEKYYNQVFKK